MRGFPAERVIFLVLSDVEKFGNESCLFMSLYDDLCEVEDGGTG